MASKRGRPLLDESESSAVNQNRKKTRERMQKIRSERKQQTTVAAPPTAEQLRQGELIINLGSLEEDIGAQTLAQVGLRVQDMTLAQDANDAQLQYVAQDVDEHDLLYETDSTENINRNSDSQPAVEGFFRRFTMPANRIAPSQSQPENSGQRSQPGLPQYFHTLPPSNPFAAPIHTPAAGEQEVDFGVPAEESDIPLYTEEDTRSDAGSTHRLATEESTEGETILRGSEDQLVESSSEDEGDATNDHDEEDSFPGFVAEHSPHSDAEEQVEPSAREYMIQKLYEQFVLEFHGCSKEQHDDKLREHMEAAGNNHHGLDEVFNNPDFPSVLGLSDMISADRLARQEMPSASDWNEMYCGISRRRSRPMNVCIHKEETQEMVCDLAYDFDSFIGFGDTPEFAKKGFWVQPVSQMRQNMTADVHIETRTFHTSDNPEQPVRSSMAMLRDVPHFLFGRVVGAHDITVHVLFPHMGVANEKFVSLTKEQMTRWLDQIFLPALHQHYDPHYTQHLPASYRHAFANSKAHQVEGRQIETASYQAQQSIGYHLQPDNLGAMWSDMLQTIASTPGLADFREPQLFFSAKGTKLQFKTSRSGARKSLLDAMESFESFFEDVFDLSFLQLDRVYVDIGKEICPQVSLLSTQRAQVGDEPQVYLPRRCCQEEYMKWMYDGRPPKMGDGPNYFYTNMLGDASSMTSVTPKRSKQREGGLIYSQFYASVKEIIDATKCFPFSNDGLEELALDPQILKGAREAAGGRRRDARIVQLAYLASKRRTRDALTDSRQKSFGIREEHRISWDLFQGLKSRLQFEGEPDAEVELVDCPAHAWAVKTSVYLDYLWRLVDKFSTGFEVVRAQCHNDFITWEQTKMMAMFLRCLRFVFGGHLLRRESALWWSRRERGIGESGQLRIWYGLGFCNTLPRYGYCWLEPRIDWSRLQFQSEVTDQMLFGNSMLRGQYLRRGGRVQAFFDTTRRMELALQWLANNGDVEAVRERMLLWIVHICLQQFRMDVLQCVKVEMKEQGREEALEGEQPFCFEWLEEVMADGVYLMSGNRCDFKVVPSLASFLFEFDDGRVRNHWKDRPFRKLYRRAKVAIGMQGRELQQSFTTHLLRVLFQQHWVLPYPCADAFMQTTKQGERMWYSIQPQEGVVASEAAAKDWKWARKDWEAGRPKDLPMWLQWRKDEWETWVEQRGGRTV